MVYVLLSEKVPDKYFRNNAQLQNGKWEMVSFFGCM